MKKMFYSLDACAPRKDSGQPQDQSVGSDSLQCTQFLVAWDSLSRGYKTFFYKCSIVLSMNLKCS